MLKKPTSHITTPYTHNNDDANSWHRLQQNLSNKKHESFLKQICSKPDTAKIINAILQYSPYLTRLITQYTELLNDIINNGLDITYAKLMLALDNQLKSCNSEQELMAVLRQFKAKNALLIAWADISAQWSLERITTALTTTAELTLQATIDYLLHKLATKGEISFNNRNNNKQTGIIILAMGKMGGYELNYSSDIDLVLLYDTEYIYYNGRHSLQHCLNRLTQDLVRIMQERTADGYVFRTDLRLRPDPASTPPIINVEAAIRYYENVGQNWERAAFIKARPVAGDMQAGDKFLQQLKPFLWRKNLDFAAIADIQSLKRQMNNQQPDSLTIAGHNIKIGLGGIREIEFIAQIHQLIWGGKNPLLRHRNSCETLHQLAQSNIIDTKTANILINHYKLLRHIEHRLQMINDQQTHIIPEDESKRTLLANFCGYENLEQFENILKQCLLEVHQIYTTSFNNEPSLADSGNLSFTGVEADNATINTIRNMGYKNPEQVIYTIQNWHRGHIRATRSVRARQLLTELTPTLLRALSKTADPDVAFTNLDKFLTKLPAGVQLFSLFSANPCLLDHIAKIMGCAPRLAEHFSRHPELLETIITPQPSNITNHKIDINKHILQQYLCLSNHPDDDIEWLCRFRNEQEFLIGTSLLQGNIDPIAANIQLSKVADLTINQLLEIVQTRFADKYGIITGGNVVILGLGRLGSSELTFGSDLDLIFCYHSPDGSTASDGNKSLYPTTYYNRLFQRLVTSLQITTAEGKLYDIDTRLRPDGESGPLATSRNSFAKYYTSKAWIFEKMALMRHRVITANNALAKQLENIIHNSLRQPISKQVLTHDVLDMRKRINTQFGSDDCWNCKYARGGIIDICFYSQWLALCNGSQHPELLTPKISDIILTAYKLNLIDKQKYEQLETAYIYQEKILSVLRLCQQNFIEETAPEGLKALMCDILQVNNFSTLREELYHHQNNIYNIFSVDIGDYTT